MSGVVRRTVSARGEVDVESGSVSMSVTSAYEAHEDSSQVHACGSQSPDECFDPASCCDAAEQMLISRLRHMLRPVAAPEQLISRIESTLDRCCLESEARDSVE